MCLIVSTHEAIFSNSFAGFKVAGLCQIFVEEGVNSDVTDIAPVEQVHIP